MFANVLPISQVEGFSSPDEVRRLYVEHNIAGSEEDTTALESTPADKHILATKEDIARASSQGTCYTSLLHTNTTDSTPQCQQQQLQRPRHGNERACRPWAPPRSSSRARLQAHPAVEVVIYPDLTSHLQHGVAWASLSPHAQRWVQNAATTSAGLRRVLSLVLSHHTRTVDDGVISGVKYVYPGDPRAIRGEVYCPASNKIHE
jgi:hypothetical protein